MKTTWEKLKKLIEKEVSYRHQNLKDDSMAGDDCYLAGLWAYETILKLMRELEEKYESNLENS